MKIKNIIGIIAAIILAVVIMAYKVSDKETELSGGFDTNAFKVEGSFKATGMDTRLNQTVVHEMDVVKGDVTGVKATGQPPSTLPSFEVKTGTNTGGPEKE